MGTATREVLIEMARMGSIMRVTAVDAATGIEVVIQGPANASQKELQRIAIAKLNYVMKRKKP
ncbi:MAG: hypothetical protein PHY92_02115 [Alphaproteobacteria bacterium]|nr:hypothetical protein [Alphaproteobacteria bacterium]